MYSSLNQGWFHDHCKCQKERILLTPPAPQQPIAQHQMVRIWGGRSAWARPAERALTSLLGASEKGPRPGTLTHAARSAMEPMPQNEKPTILVGSCNALLHSPDPPASQSNGLKNRTAGEFAEFVLLRVIMTAVHLTLSSFSRGERSSTILAWTRSKNCL